MRKTIVISTSWRFRPIPRHFISLAEHLSENNYKVILLLKGKKRTLNIKSSNITVKSWPVKSKSYIANCIFLLKIIKKYKSNILISNFSAVNAFAIVGKIIGVKYNIGWYHTVSGASEVDSNYSFFKLSLLRKRKSIFYRLLTHIIAPSNYALNDFFTTYRIKHINKLVYPNSIPDPQNQNRLKISSEKEYDLVSIGSLLKNKGHDVLVKSIHILKSRKINLSIAIVGNGPELKVLKKNITDLELENNISIIKNMDNDGVYDILSKAKVLVVPSRYEAFGIVNIEAFSMGVPVIGSDIGAISEIIDHGKNGLLFKKEDSLDLSKKIEFLLKNKLLLKKFGANAREKYVKYYSSKNAIEQQTSLIKSLS